ncbi:uncharacterized protein LOC143291721 [Babylonia areolata]|uniref:uncharacterized protein LOC143291721 n=1 Tax=Babylonia areolata TaxID=304850 RepID=UPI003FD30F8B
MTTVSTVSLAMVMVCTRDTRGAVTCTAFTTTSETHVVCNFGHDISRTSLNVRFFYPDLHADPETTVMCNYVTGSGGLVCQTADDVTSTTVVSDQMTITRGAALDKVGGQYICQPVPPPDSMRFEPCNLTYLDSSPPRSSPAEPTTQSSKAAQTEHDEILDDVKASVALTAVVLSLLLVTCVIVPIIAYIKRDSIVKWWVEHTTERLWPGYIKDPRDTDPRRPTAAVIPEGLPVFFYNLGWKEAHQDIENQKNDVRDTKEVQDPPRRGQDTRHGQGPGGRDTRHGQGPGGRDTRHGQGPGGRDTCHGQGPGREEHPMTNVTSAPPVPHQAVQSAATSFTTVPAQGMTTPHSSQTGGTHSPAASQSQPPSVTGPQGQKLPDSPQTAAPSTEDEDWCDVRAGPSSIQLEHVEASIPLLTGGPGHSASSEEHGPGGESKQQKSDKGSKKGHENADKKAMKEKKEAEKRAKKEREEAEKKAKKEKKRSRKES